MPKYYRANYLKLQNINHVLYDAADGIYPHEDSISLLDQMIAHIKFLIKTSIIYNRIAQKLEEHADTTEATSSLAAIVVKPQQQSGKTPDKKMKGMFSMRLIRELSSWQEQGMILKSFIASVESMFSCPEQSIEDIYNHCQKYFFQQFQNTRKAILRKIREINSKCVTEPEQKKKDLPILENQLLVFLKRLPYKLYSRFDVERIDVITHYDEEESLEFNIAQCVKKQQLRNKRTLKEINKYKHQHEEYRESRRLQRTLRRANRDSQSVSTKKISVFGGSSASFKENRNNQLPAVKQRPNAQSLSSYEQRKQTKLRGLNEESFKIRSKVKVFSRQKTRLKLKQR